MLSDEEKQDVITNIDTYSLEEIEAKLSVICVRNKLDLSGKPAEDNTLADTTFSLNEDDDEEDNVPAIVSALRAARENR